MVIVALIGLTSTHVISADRHWRIVMVVSIWLLDFNLPIWGSVVATIVYAPGSWIKISVCGGSVGVAIVYAPVIDLFFSNTCHCFIKTNWISMHAFISQYSKKVWHYYIGHSWIIIQNFNQWQYLLVFLDPYIQKYRIIINCQIRSYQTSCCHGELLDTICHMRPHVVMVSY